jgi:hypothetical protein
MASTKPYVSENPNLRPLAKLAGWLVLIVFAVIAIAYTWYPRASRLWSRYTGGSTAPFGVRQSVSNDRPRLQVDEIVDYQDYKKKQDALLGGYGWVNRTQGVVRIPVERAMDRLLERGLPTRKAAP